MCLSRNLCDADVDDDEICILYASKSNEIMKKETLSMGKRNDTWNVTQSWNHIIIKDNIKNKNEKSFKFF